MNKNRVTKFLSILLTMCMLLGMLPMTALADNFSDIKGHWAESQINEMINEGIVKGYPDGSFKPDGDISRAEFVSLIVKAFKLTKAKGKDFDDISNHWAKDAILTANAHGIVNGYSDTKFGPDDPITREQMAVIIVKVAHLTDNSKGKTFVDSQDISEWAKKAVAIASSNQLITGYPDNTFKPSGNASRAEATAVLSKSLTIVNLPVEIDYSSIENSGKYGPETGNEIIESDVIIKAKDVILQNLIIKGDLIISKEVGDGDATLNNVKVEGKTYIRGGGIDSIHINQGEYREIIIERTITGAVRILTANVQRISITISENDNGEDVILNGEIKTVTIKADGIKVISQGETTIDKIEVTRGLKDVKIELTEDTEVKEIILDSKVDVKGKGEIEKASGSKIRESTFVTAPKRIITPSTGGNGSSSSGGSGSGGTSTTPTIKVSAININKSTTTLVEGTTETLTVTFTPSNASNKTITWTTSDEAVATVSGGVVTAVAEGTATITATSNNGKTATCVVTVEEPESNEPSMTVSPAEVTINSDFNTTFTLEIANATVTEAVYSEYISLGGVFADLKVIDIDRINDTAVTAAVDGNLASAGTGTIILDADALVNSESSLKADVTVVQQGTVVPVSAISVKGTDDATEITTDGGTLQMIATVSPSNASNKAVTWNVDNTSIATIDGNGLLTAVANGTVEVTASAKDSSGVKGTTTVEILGQTVVPVDKNIKSVGTIADINVANGTELASVGLPTTVEVTLDDDTTQSLTVTWDGGNPVYAKDTAGTYEFSGTLTLPANVTNTSNLTATVKVIVAEAVPVDKNIKSVGTIADINVANGTELASVGLPTTVVVTLDDDTTQSLTVTWDGGNPVYAKDTAGTYEFSGTLTLPANVTNTSNLTASVKVIVAEAVVDKYVVTFSVVDGNGSIKAEVDGTEINSGDEVEEGSKVIFTATPNAGYKVKEWTLDGTPAAETGNTFTINNLTAATTVTVEFEATTETYKVTYDANTGSGDVPTDSTEYAANAEVTVAGEGSLTKEHYLFDGWNTKDDGSGTAYAENDTFKIMANTTLYAQWTPVITSIVIKESPTKTEYADLDNLDLTGLVVTVHYAKGDTADIPFVDFEANYISTTYAHGHPVTKTEHQTLNVGWKGNKDVVANVEAYKVYYRVTFDAQGGTVSPADALTKGESGIKLTELPTPTKDEFTFKGWFDAATEGVEVDANYQFTKNTTIYAQWTEVVTPVPVTGVSLNESTMSLTVGGATGTLTATVTPENATNKNVSWSSSDEAVATVDATGKVTAVAVGSVTITVTTVDGNFKATCDVTVSAASVAVTGVSLDQTAMNLTVGGATGTLTATVAPAEATNKNVSWSSSNEGVATVSNGVVTPVSAGTTTITVTTDDGNKTATCDVTVTAATIPVTGVTLDQTTMNLTAGGATGTLTATVNPENATNKNISWSSSDTGVATVLNGVVTPVAAGSTTITVTTADGNLTATCDVTVTAATVAVTGVTLNESTMSLTAGGATGTLTATVTPENATNKNVSWSSSNEGVATVSNGVVTPVAAGSTTITVTTTDGGKTATCTVTVESAPDKVVNLRNIPGITIPAKDGVPVTAVGANDQYTGIVTWNPNVEKFGQGQIYTATIVLSAKTGYTLAGITEANFFSVIGATSTTYDSNSKTVTVTFPTTGDKPAQTGSPKISGDPIYGVGLMAQSDGLGHVFGGVTFTWYRSEDANFDENTDTPLTSTGTDGQNYTIVEADIGKYLIVKAVNPNSTGYGFRVVGPVIKANVVGDVEGSISAYYLSDGDALYIRGINPDQGELEVAVAINGTDYTTEYTPIGENVTTADITGLTGVSANTKVKIRKAATTTHNASKDKVIEGEKVKVRHKLTLEGGGLTVNKDPDVFGGHNTYSETYLIITITPPANQVVDTLKVNGEKKDLANDGNYYFTITKDTTIEVTYTDIKTITIQAIQGVTPPVAGYTPVTSIMETAQYTGTISWNPGHDTFGKDQIYTATITLEAKHPFSFDGVASDFFTVAGATLVTNDANSGVVKATFPKTGAEQVSLLEIHDHQVVKPQKGYAIKADPFTSYGGTYVEYDGTTVRWYEEGNETEVSGYFEANTVYIAKVNLEAKEGYTFAGLSSNSFGYGGTSTSVTFTIDPNDSKKGLVTITFPATEKDQVEEPVITVSETHPSNRKDDVTLTVTPVEGVTYYYTLDESDPSNSSTRIEYKGVATLPAPDNDEQVNMLIKVIGVRDGYIDSEIATKTVYYQPVVNVGVESYIAKDRADEIYVDLSIMNVELEKENFTVNKNGSAYTDFSVAKQGNGFDYILTLGQDAQATDVFTLTIDKLGYRFNGGSAVENRLGVYKLTYDANYADSGTVPEDNGMYDDGESVTILGNTGSLVKANHSFEGWNTKADGSGTNYKENDSFTITGNTMLYANWKAIGIKVDGVEVPLTNGPLSTDENSNLNKLSWDFATKTLTMDGFIGETMSTIGFKDDIVIELSGDNKLTNQADEGPSLSLWSSLEIKGNGKLEIKGKNVGVSHGSWSPLTIKDSATLIIDNSYNSSGNMSGISNCQNLTVEDAAKLEVKLEYQGQYGVAVTGVDANIINNSSQPIEITVYNRLAGGATVSTEMPSLHNGSKGLAYQGEVALASGKGTTTDPIEISYKIYSTTTLKANDIRLGKISIEEIWSDNFDGTLIAADEPISLTDPIYVKSNGKYYKISIEKDASKINIGGTEYSLDSSFNVPGLSWDNNSNTLIMDGYNDGAYIHGYIQQTALLTEITINVVGENSITADGMEALLFDKLSIIGDDKANDKLSVTVTGDKSRAVYYNSSIKDVTLKIDADLGDSYNQNRGIHGNMLVDNGHLEIVARKDNTGTNTIYGVSERLTFASGGSADIELTDKQGSRVSVALNMPSIGSYDNNSGYLVNGAWYGKLTVDTDKDGSSTEKARELVYKVSQATADALTFEHIAVSGGSPAITYTWDSASWSVYNSESFEEGNQITAETMEATKLFTEAISEGDKKIITVKDDKNGKYYKITIEVENQPVEP